MYSGIVLASARIEILCGLVRHRHRALRSRIVRNSESGCTWPTKSIWRADSSQLLATYSSFVSVKVQDAPRIRKWLLEASYTIHPHSQVGPDPSSGMTEGL